MDIEALHGNSGGQATWLALFVEIAGEVVGPDKDDFVRNIRAREQGTRNGFVQGFNSSAMVSEVTLSNVYMWANTTPATTLQEDELVQCQLGGGHQDHQ